MPLAVAAVGGILRCPGRIIVQVVLLWLARAFAVLQLRRCLVTTFLPLRSMVWEDFFEKLKKNNQWHVEVY